MDAPQSRAVRWTEQVLLGAMIALAAALSACTLHAQSAPPKRKPGPTATRPKPAATLPTKAGGSSPKSAAPAPAAVKPEPVAPAPEANTAPAAPAPASSATAPIRTPRRARDAESRDTPWYAHPKRTWFTLGLATGNGGLGCAICRPNQTRAVAAHAAAGWAIRPRLVLGLQGQTWLDVFGDGFDQTMLHGQAIARWYPFARQPLSITGGVGALAYRVDDGAFVLRAQTLATQLTVGWELPTRVGMTVTPFVSMLTTAPARLRGANGFSLADDARFGLVQGGVALSWF